MSLNLLAPEKAIETMRAMLAGTPELTGAEILIRHHKGLKIKVRSSEVESHELSDCSGVALRLARRGKIAQSYCSSLEMEAIKEMVVRCMAALDQTSEDPDAEILPMLYDSDPASLEIVDENFQLIPEAEKINRLFNLESNVLKFDTRMERVMGVHYHENADKEWLWTLGSRRVLHTSKSHASVYAGAVAKKGDERSTGWDGSHEIQYFDLDWSGVAKNSAMLALKTLGGKPIESGSYSVILHHSVMTDLLKVFSRALLGDQVMYQNSFLANDIGKKIISPLITIYDDPLQRKKLGYRLWDSEGTPTARVSLIHEGRLESFAHTRRSAKILGKNPTGSAVRYTEKSAHSAGFHNLVLEPGRKDFVDLLRDMGRGLVIYEAKGIGSANLVTGDFSFGASGVWVENGEEQSPIAQIALGGNLKTLFSSVVSVGRDLKYDSPVSAPSLLFANVQVAGV